MINFLGPNRKDCYENDGIDIAKVGARTTVICHNENVSNDEGPNRMPRIIAGSRPKVPPTLLPRTTVRPSTGKSLSEAPILASTSPKYVYYKRFLKNKIFTGPRPATCHTNGGLPNNDNPDPNQECHFPFIWSGVTHNSCINDDVAGGSWCSTIVDRNGKYIDRKWGICSQACPGK